MTNFELIWDFINLLTFDSFIYELPCFAKIVFITFEIGIVINAFGGVYRSSQNVCISGTINLQTIVFFLFGSHLSFASLSILDSM